MLFRKAGNSGSKGRILLQRWNSPILPLLITAIIYFVLIFLTVRGHGYDFSYFVCAGDKWSGGEAVPKSLTVLTNSPGYDGQFYYRLALDPFTSRATDFGITLDVPAYRHQRIVYPLIVWALSLGCISCVPVLMVVVNFFCLCVLGWLGALFARSMRLHSLWGLAFPFYPGLLLSLWRDLGDVLCACFLLASLLFVRHRKYSSAMLLLILAVLTRETVLLVAVGAAYVCMKGIRNEKGADGLPRYFWLFPFLAYSIWQFILLRNWGYRLWNKAHFGVADRSLGWPFAGFLRSLLFDAALETEKQRVEFVEMLLIVVFAAVVVWSMRSSVASRLEKSSWVLYAGLAFLLKERHWVEDWAFLRILSEFYVLGAIILLGSPSKTKMPVFLCWGTVWLSSFLRFTDILSRTLRRLT
jgi:hypothetical protein